MDSKQLLHIGAEAVIVAGITLYFTSKIETLHQEIHALKDYIKKQEEITSNNFNAMYKILMDNGLKNTLEPKKPDVTQEIAIKEPKIPPKEPERIQEISPNKIVENQEKSEIKPSPEKPIEEKPLEEKYPIEEKKKMKKNK